ncbi:hypothetical protein [Cryobacterium sp. PAMC25264]|uniref:hypothetical protein n=1 Tax=Cryobacterium sp. PAMC25264 TaxID=2861288 RepID=UPI001C63B7A3|nr:hypothetical protein [Cryobacterium sp. PAMC25264]QYF72807.1 hypothetical protein KY500_13575 [Cryobacterium sp. PAMC25264]
MPTTPLTRTERTDRLERRFGRGLTWTVLVGAVGWGLLATVVGIVTVLAQLVQDRFDVTLLADTPVPDAASGGTARLVDGSFDTAEVTVTGLSALPRFLLTLEGATTVATTLLVSATVAYFCWGVLRRRPFSRPVFALVALVGYALLLGTILGQGFGGLGRMIAAGELNGAGVEGFWPLATVVDLGPAGTGLVLLVAAGAISIGQRMQRDTDGLI